MNKRFGAIAGAIAALLAFPLGGASAGAQMLNGSRAAGAPVPVVLPGPAVPCPHPYHYTVTRGGHMNATTGVYNQTAINQIFEDTFVLPKPPPGDCCQYQSGTLTVTYRALQGGPANSSTSANDDAGLGPMRPTNNWTRVWLNNTGSVATGAVKTITYPIPPAMIASGSVIFGVEDDTAVVSATLSISGCCVTPQR